MQKRPKYPYSYAGLELDAEFPFVVSKVHEQGDRVITHLHFHNFPELGLCLDGAGVFVVEGKTMPFKSGDLVFIGREERHLARSVRGTVSRWHWFYFDLERLLCPAFMNTDLADLSSLKGPSFANVISGETNPRLRSIALELLDSWREKGPFKKEKIIALLALFAAEMRRLFEAVPKTREEDSAPPDPDIMRRLNKAVELIARGHGGKMSMTRLAGNCGLSPTHFRRLFRRAFGKSPRRRLGEIRVAMAMSELDRSRRPISEIALSCGFDTISCFNRQFKAATGLSPRQWRERHAL